jgi:hypothetical protein
MMRAACFEIRKREARAANTGLGNRTRPPDLTRQLTTQRGTYGLYKTPSTPPLLPEPSSTRLRSFHPPAAPLRPSLPRTRSSLISKQVNQSQWPAVPPVATATARTSPYVSPQQPGECRGASD